MNDSKPALQAIVTQDGGIHKPKPFSKEANFEIENDFFLSVSWDRATEEITFKVQMPTDAYLALSFGAHQEDFDMVVFQSEMQNPRVIDGYYHKDSTKFVDASQDWVSEISDFGSRRNKLFVSRRQLDTGDEQDYAIQLDRQMKLSYQFSRETSVFEKQDFKHPLDLLFLSDGQTIADWQELLQMRRVSTYEAHGIWCFFVWMPLGFLLLATKRYLKGNWKVWHVVHIVVGLITLVITIWQTLEISLKFGLGLVSSPHSILGTIVILVTIISVFTGTLAAAYMKYYNGDEEWAKNERALIIGKIHRYSSYFVLFLANVVILGGTITYCMTYLKESKFIPLGIVSFLVFLNFVLVSEYLHRRKARSENLAHKQKEESEEDNQNKTGRKGSLGQVKVYTAQQVDIAVERGEKLVLLDNLVLNTNGYERQHPGGKFVLIKNFGRDISKFYYGGYALMQEKGAFGVYTHSETSRQIVKQMVVGYLTGQKDVQDTKCTVLCRYNISPVTATFVMNTTDNRNIKDWRNWFSDVQMIGKHFLIYSQAIKDIKRHYTICNVMIPENKNELVSLCQQIIKGECINFNGRLFGDSDQSSICVTVKNYKGPGGMSTQLFAAVTEDDQPVTSTQTERGLLDNADQFDWSPQKNEPKKLLAKSEDIFYVKGPMGKGLQIEERGIHIAFCAGTGVLVYLDLVGHLILRNSLPFIRHSNQNLNRKNDSMTQSDINPSKPSPPRHYAYDKLKFSDENVVTYKQTTASVTQFDDFPEQAYSVLSDHFQFHLYVSFQNEESSIGIDLCHTLLELNKKLKLNNFKLSIRYSESKPDVEKSICSKPRRWDKDFILEELYPLKGKMSRIWVCGPPIMNQSFDQSLEELQEKLQLRSNQIEIM